MFPSNKCQHKNFINAFINAVLNLEHILVVGVSKHKGYFSQSWELERDNWIFLIVELLNFLDYETFFFSTLKRYNCKNSILIKLKLIDLWYILLHEILELSDTKLLSTLKFHEIRSIITQ